MKYLSLLLIFYFLNNVYVSGQKGRLLLVGGGNEKNNRNDNRDIGWIGWIRNAEAVQFPRQKNDGQIITAQPGDVINSHQYVI